MSRKHYVAIAAAFRAQLSPVPASAEAVACVASLALDLARVFENDNSAFDKARFLAACGVN
jgi:hypothetical protein